MKIYQGDFKRVMGDVPLTLNNLIQDINYSKNGEVEDANKNNIKIMSDVYFCPFDAFGLDEAGDAILSRNHKQIQNCLDTVLKETANLDELVILSFKNTDGLNSVAVFYKGVLKFCNFEASNDYLFNFSYKNVCISVCDIEENSSHFNLIAPLIFLYGNTPNYLKYVDNPELYPTSISQNISSDVFSVLSYYKIDKEIGALLTPRYFWNIIDPEVPLYQKRLFKKVMPNKCDFPEIAEGSPDKISTIANPLNPFNSKDKSVNYPLIIMEPELSQKYFSSAAASLAKRALSIHAKGFVIGLSGGIDSTAALLMALSAVNLINEQIDESWSKKNILAVSMPCFGTSDETRKNAKLLADSYGVEFLEIDITKSVKQHFKDIKHSEDDKNVVYENAQSRERMQVLFDLANERGYLQIGTSDLSESCLGWCTYAGDQAAMYNANLSFSKTQLEYLLQQRLNRLARIIEANKNNKEVKAEDLAIYKSKAEALKTVLNTPVSPELLPPGKDGKISQKTEDINGPYKVIDIIIYLYFWLGKEKDEIIQILFKQYDGVYEQKNIVNWTDNFFSRLLHSQFKRSTSASYPLVTKIGYAVSKFKINEEMI